MPWQVMGTKILQAPLKSYTFLFKWKKALKNSATTNALCITWCAMLFCQGRHPVQSQDFTRLPFSLLLLQQLNAGSLSCLPQSTDCSHAVLCGGKMPPTEDLCFSSCPQSSPRARCTSPSFNAAV